MDAPFHYGPLSGGRPARKIGEIPLSRCYGRGVRLDLRHRGSGEAITATDIQQAIGKTDTELRPLDIVLIWTGSDKHWGSASYLTDYPGLTRDAVAYLVEQGVYVIGTDAWGLDRPMAAMLDDYRCTGYRSYLWPAHLYGREQEYWSSFGIIGREQICVSNPLEDQRQLPRKVVSISNTRIGS